MSLTNEVPKVNMCEYLEGGFCDYLWLRELEGFRFDDYYYHDRFNLDYESHVWYFKDGLILDVEIPKDSKGIGTSDIKVVVSKDNPILILTTLLNPTSETRKKIITLINKLIEETNKI